MSIEFFLDNRPVTAEPGETILDVARKNGIEIPTLCRDERVSKTTSCFVCVVKDKKTGKLYRVYLKIQEVKTTTRVSSDLVHIVPIYKYIYYGNAFCVDKE